MSDYKYVGCGQAWLEPGDTIMDFPQFVSHVKFTDACPFMTYTHAIDAGKDRDADLKASKAVGDMLEEWCNEHPRHILTAVRAEHLHYYRIEFRDTCKTCAEDDYRIILNKINKTIEEVFKNERRQDNEV